MRAVFFCGSRPCTRFEVLRTVPSAVSVRHDGFCVIILGARLAVRTRAAAEWMHTRYAAVGVEVGLFEWTLLYAFPERVFGIMSNYVLLAVPFFIFMPLVIPI